jgi:hypothetical protein
MKPREFYEIMVAFVEEDKRWKALKVGDNVYTASPAGLDIDYFRAVIKEINLEERFIIVYDKSDRIYPDREVKLTHFITQEEFDNLKY